MSKAAQRLNARAGYVEPVVEMPAMDLLLTPTIQAAALKAYRASKAAFMQSDEASALFMAEAILDALREQRRDTNAT